MNRLPVAAQEAANALADLKAEVARARSQGFSLRDIANVVTSGGYRVTHSTVDEWGKGFGPVGPDADVIVIRPAIGSQVAGSRAQKLLYRFVAEQRPDGTRTMRAEVAVEDAAERGVVGLCWADPLTHDQLRALAVAVVDGPGEVKGTITGDYKLGTGSHGEPFCECGAEWLIRAEASTDDGQHLELAVCCGWQWR